MVKYKTASDQELLDELHRTERMQDETRRYFDGMYEELQDVLGEEQRAKDYSKDISNQMLSAVERGKVLSDRWLELAGEILRRRGL